MARVDGRENGPARARIFLFVSMAAIASAASGQVQVQLGAYGNRAQAEAAWTRVRPAHPGLAGDQPSYVSGPGVIRLRVDRPNNASARQLCTSLHSKGAACFVAGPTKSLGAVAPATGAAVRVPTAAPKSSKSKHEGRPVLQLKRERLQPLPAKLPVSGSALAPTPHQIGAATVFAYNPASAFPLNGEPGFITTIVLEPGEKLLSKALGEPGSWAINEASQGAGGDGFASQQLIYVKPKAAGAATNLVLTTDRRSYQIELSSNRKLPRTRLLAWNFAPAQAERPSRKGSPQ